MELFKEKYYENETFENVEWSEDLQDIEFCDCTFRNSSLQSTRLIHCNFDRCEFVQSNLSLVEIVHTAFLDTRFTDCKMIGVVWSATAGFLSAAYDNCLLNNNSFADMNLTRFTFSSCSFIEASFYHTKLAHAVFHDCDLSGCQFSQVDLSHADFTTARNYVISAEKNTLHKTQFSLPEAQSLLANFDIVLK